MAEGFLTQPLQIVMGSEGGSKWMSDEPLQTRRQQGQARALSRAEPYETV
jgi:hypothetical protein